MTGTVDTGALPDIRFPATLTFICLAAGLALGIALQGSSVQAPLLAIAGPVGELWLQALKMTILPLVAGLLFTGIVDMAAAARAGAMARRTLGLFVAILAGGGIMAAIAMPLLLKLTPVPLDAATALGGSGGNPGPIPGVTDFLASIIPENIVAAASEGAMLPVIVFLSLFALASTRLPEKQRSLLTAMFRALASTMMVMIGWVLALAPLGVFALGFGLAAQSGEAAVGALAHYILLVVAIGAIILLGAYVLAVTVARQRLIPFARALLPAQAVAISTQSSLASLPAMLASCRKLDLADTSSEFVLPLAVTLFRATSPAMNIAVAIYVASLAGIELSIAALAAGVLVASVTTFGTVSLPGTISFVASVGPIALAMGIPVEALALLVAVEMLPDIMRTLANVTMNVAVTAVIDRNAAAEPNF
ncbi:MAG: cation:dicarboxylase symporter family transporter [Novosphingobium sp.]|nr:cation:dicarboxylase symporter family transporter [Novosphingobium sp.]